MDLSPKKPQPQRQPQRSLPPEQEAPEVLRERVKARVRALRGQAAENIRLWRDLAVIRKRKDYEKWGYDDFFVYLAKDAGITTKRYIKECLQLGTLSAQRYEGCVIAIDVLLVVVAMQLGPLAQDALAEATRQDDHIKTPQLHRALELLEEVPDDGARARKLRAWFIEGQPLEGEEPEPGDGDEEEKEPKVMAAEEVGEAIVTRIGEWRELRLYLAERLRQGDALSPAVVSKLRALLVEQPGEVVALAELVGLALAPGGWAAAPAGERRQQPRPAAAEETAEPLASEEAAKEDAEPLASEEAAKEVAEPPASNEAAEEAADPPASEEAAQEVAGSRREPCDGASSDKAPDDGAAAPPTGDAPSDEPAAPSDEPPPLSAPPPALRSPDLVPVAIPYPEHRPPGGPPFSALDRLALEIIALVSCARARLQILRTLDSGRPYGLPLPVAPLLCAYAHQRSCALDDELDDLDRFLGPLAQAGLALLEPAFRAHYSDPTLPVPSRMDDRERHTLCVAAARSADPLPPLLRLLYGWDPVLPVIDLPSWGLPTPHVPGPSDDDPDPDLPAGPLPPRPVDPPDVPILHWAILDEGEARYWPQATVLDALVVSIIVATDGFLRSLTQLLDRLAHDREGRKTLDPQLAAQAYILFYQLWMELQHWCNRHQDAVAEGRLRRAALELAILESKQEADARLVVLGESQRPELYIVIGSDDQGRTIAVTAETPQLMFMVGATGWGKTHLMRVLGEGASRLLPGLNTLRAPQRVVSLEIDYNRGSTRRQMLEGFRLNPKAEQLQALYEHYGYRAQGNEAYTRGTLLVLPDSVERLRRELAPLCERGLVIEPAVCNSRDLGLVGYRSLVASARGLDGARRPQYMGRFEVMVNQLGKDVSPRGLMGKLQESKLRADVKESMIAQLDQVKDLIIDGPSVTRHLESADPVFVLLESSMLSPDVILPYQAVLVNALTRPLEDGSDPMRWIFQDEFNKSSLNEVVSAISTEQGQERRHRHASFGANGQRVTGMDGAFFSNATLVFVFRQTSLREIRALKTRYAMFEDIPDEVFLNLGHGECLIGAILSTGQAQVYRVKIRPTVLNAGGETLRVGSG